MAQKQKPTQDSLAYYDDLFNELDSFLDSICMLENVFLRGLGIVDSWQLTVDSWQLTVESWESFR